MNQSTFNSALVLIEQRWPFPDEAKEHKVSYVARLKLQVSSWTGAREEGFKKAVDALVGATNQRGRPSPEQIVELSFSRAGVSHVSQEQPVAPTGPYPGGFFRSPEERKEAAETLRAWLQRNRARMARSPVFGGVDGTLVFDETARALAPERPDDYRERVRAAVEDWRDSQPDDHGIEEIPF